jgi:hypothetical protein
LCGVQNKNPRVTLFTEREREREREREKRERDEKIHLICRILSVIPFLVKSQTYQENCLCEISII